MGGVERVLRSACRWRSLPSGEPGHEGTRSSECVALNQFEDESRHAATVVEAIDCADVGMVQSREQPRFPLSIRAALRIRNEMRRQDLDRDLATELRVTGAIHLAHSTRPQQGSELVDPDLASHE